MIGVIPVVAISKGSFTIIMVLNQENSYDAIIVGAGPSGCAAGKILAESGARVLIIERSVFPRDKVCGGLVTKKTLDLIEKRLGYSDVKNIIQTRSDGFEIYNRTDFKNRVRSEREIYFCSRKVFDYYLLQKAEKAGCSVIEGEVVREFFDNFFYVRDKKVDFKYLIGADGANSRIRKKLGKSLNKQKMALGLKVDIPRFYFDNFKSHILPKVYFGYIKHGWGWIFPQGKNVSIGLAGLLGEPSKLKSIFHYFLEELDLLKALELSNIKAAWVPYGTYLRRPGKRNVFLVGDAAGFVEPITGEGIYFGLLSGILAAESILSDKENKILVYEQRCRKYIFKFLNQALISRFFLFESPFKSLALNRFKKNKKHMEDFMELLSGNIDYIKYFQNILSKNR